MKSPLAVVANGFFAGSALLGLPSLIGTLLFGWYALNLWLSRTPPPADPARTGNAIFDLLGSAIKGAATGARFLGDLGFAFAAGLCVASLIALAAAALMFFTARGLHAGQLWARITAGLLTFSLTGIAAILFLSTRGSMVAPFSAALSLASACALWIVWRG